MILTGNEIQKQVNLGRIRIKEFNPEQLSTNSYDIRLGTSLLRYEDDLSDPHVASRHSTLPIPASGFLLRRGDFVLASSQEEIGSDFYVPLLHARSSVARLGLFVHVTADLIDIGSHGCLTLQLFAARDVMLYPRMLIGQVSFWQPAGEIRLYDGKYQGSKGPRASMIHLDQQR